MSLGILDVLCGDRPGLDQTKDLWVSVCPGHTQVVRSSIDELGKGRLLPEAGMFPASYTNDDHVAISDGTAGSCFVSYSSPIKCS